jgi:arylformamidase
MKGEVMEIFDISLPIKPGMVNWPGDPGVEIDQVSEIEAGDSANVSHLSLGVHTGTHVDAPSHFIRDGDPLDKVPIQHFVGDVEVIELLDIDLITKSDLEKISSLGDSSRVLFKTRNSRFWGERDNIFREDFVALSPDGARYLADLGIKLVGIDYLSIAPFNESTPTHKVLLGAGVSVIEGLDLSRVFPGRYTLYCLPLKILDSDGAPARVILVR